VLIILMQVVQWDGDWASTDDSNWHSTHCGHFTAGLMHIQTYWQTPFEQPLFQNNLCKPASERLDQSGFWWSKRWQWHQLDHMQIICTLLQTDNHASTSSLNFLQARTNSIEALQAKVVWRAVIKTMNSCLVNPDLIPYLSQWSYQL